LRDATVPRLADYFETGAGLVVVRRFVSQGHASSLVGGERAVRGLCVDGGEVAFPGALGDGEGGGLFDDRVFLVDLDFGAV
jgi:hypothetical protein